MTHEDSCAARATPAAERRKRLPEEDRRRMVLSAAETVFCGKGFGAATMDDVAQIAGMSKKTLYTLFDSKMALFRELLLNYRQRQETLFAPPAMEGPAEQQLNWYLEHIRSVALAKEKIALHRMVMREALIAPDLADVFMEVVIDPGPMGLISLIERLQGGRPLRGGLDAREAAEMLLGMAFGVALHKLMLSDRYQPDEAQARHRICSAVRIFVSGLDLGSDP